MTSGWMTDRALVQVADRYASYETPQLGYATVRDFVDSFEHLNSLACAQGDLKDVQRPWTLKTIISSVPPGSRLLEIGGGQPYVADLLSRLGYEVWLVDPYDGSGAGPVEFDDFRAACPKVRFVRDRFSDRLLEIPANGFECVFSISVLEHLDQPGLDAVFAGMQRCLARRGRSIHAVDHVLRGKGAAEHLANLRYLTMKAGIPSESLDRLLSDLAQDTETYYLSAESHNRWRGSVPYEEFPMRVCVSIHLATAAHYLNLTEPRVALFTDCLG
jgi:ubiquinone/menaquinone biosynthesis C-methylase UbiE